MKPLTTKIKYLDNLLLGTLAGVAIGVGGFLNLLLNSVSLKYVGGICFSVGLFTVCFFGLHLYTGKIGYIKENDKTYPLSLLIMFIGNMIGAVGIGYLLSLTGLAKETALKVSDTKAINFDSAIVNPMLKVLLYSFFCGIMVFLAVHIFKTSKHFVLKTFALVTFVALFVITGMEHCIANMFYFAYANAYASNIFGCITAIAIATLGNSLGAIFTYFVFDSISKKA